MPGKPNLNIGSLEASFRDVLLPFGLKVDAVRILAANTDIEKHKFKIKMREPAEVLATVSETNLTDFLNKEQPGGLQDFEVQLQAGKLYVSATAKMIFEIRAKAICSLEIREGKQIWIVLDSVEMLGVGAKGLVEKQLEKLNPILDANDFPVDLTIMNVTISEGELILIGLLTP